MTVLRPWKAKSLALAFLIGLPLSLFASPQKAGIALPEADLGQVDSAMPTVLALPLGTRPMQLYAEIDPIQHYADLSNSQLVRAYLMPISHACHVTIEGFDVIESSSASDDGVDYCLWLGRPQAADWSGSDTSLFFTARGVGGVARSIRVKLNATLVTLPQDLEMLLAVLDRLHRDRGWTLPTGIAASIRSGLSFEAIQAGISYVFKPEIGDIPRFNLIMTFSRNFLGETFARR